MTAIPEVPGYTATIGTQSAPIYDKAGKMWYGIIASRSNVTNYVLIRCNDDYSNPQVVDYGNTKEGNGGNLYVNAKGQLVIQWATHEQGHYAIVAGFPGWRRGTRR
jgi:hypothetical protein